MKDENTQTAPWTFEQSGWIRNAVVGQAYKRDGVCYRIVTLEDAKELVIQEMPVKRSNQQRAINPFK